MEDKHSKREKINYNNSKDAKIIIKSYIKKLEDDCSELTSSFKERLNSKDQFIPFKEDLISKYAENEFLFKKKMSSLKRFTLQEVFYRVEAKLLEEEKERNTEEIFNDAIEKLAKLHISGFEPGESIKTKIIKKFQAKYGQYKDFNSNNNFNRTNKAHEEYNEYMKVFIDPDNVAIEMNRLKTRKETQLKVLKSFAEANTRFLDKRTEYKLYEVHRGNLKKYEKQIDLKSSQLNTEFNSENIKNPYESVNLSSSYYNNCSYGYSSKENNGGYNNYNNVSNLKNNDSINNNTINSSLFDLNWGANDNLYRSVNNNNSYGKDSYSVNDYAKIDITNNNSKKYNDNSNCVDDFGLFNCNQESKEKEIIKISDILNIKNNFVSTEREDDEDLKEKINQFKIKKFEEYKNSANKYEEKNKNEKKNLNKKKFKLSILNDLIYNYSKNREFSIYENDIISYLIHSTKSIKNLSKLAYINYNNSDYNSLIEINNKNDNNIVRNFSFTRNNSYSNDVTEDLINIMNENEQEISNFLEIIFNSKETDNYLDLNLVEDGAQEETNTNKSKLNTDEYVYENNYYNLDTNKLFNNCFLNNLNK